MSVQYRPPTPTGTRDRCGQCGGTGQFVTRVVNGKPEGPGGHCFRCQGKGYQTDSDRTRNYWYDVKYRRCN